MSVTIKSQREIELMTKAGEILELVHEELRKALRPGMTTKAIDRLGEEIIRSYGCTPSFLDYNGYPASICVSLNEEVVHGIPTNKRTLKEGDIVSLDTGVVYKGYHSDAARTYGVGEISEKAQKLIEATREAFFEGIKYAREGNHLFDISSAIGKYAQERGYGVVEDLCGHGIGTKLHEAPMVPNYIVKRKGMKLKAGMTLAIEPMINAGGREVKWLADNWTVVTRDNSLSAHYENTVLITEGEPKLLTLSQEFMRTNDGQI